MSTTLEELPASSISEGIAALNSQLDELERAASASPPTSSHAIDWREVIDTSNDAFIATDAAGLVIEWNVKAEQLLGWTAEQAIGKQLVETAFPPSGNVENGGLKTLLSASNAGTRHELTACRSDGVEMPVEVSVSMMQCGSSIYFNAFVHDISQRHQLQVQLTHAQKLESIGQLSAGIAHEINTPTQYVGDNTRFIQESMSDLMTVLDAYSKLTEAVDSGQDAAGALSEVQRVVEDVDLDYLTTEMGEAVSQTLEGVRRVASIVRAMKDFSHPGTTAKTATDLNASIKNTITVATNEWKYVATVETDFDPQLTSVPVLPGDFNQVILNLVVNAAHAIGDVVGKSGEEKGLITVTTRHAERFAEVVITDTGTGIPEEVLSKIFDPFFTTKDVGIGSGQGLAISRNVIVDKHGGTLDASNRPEGGARFVIRIPLSDQDQGGAE